MNKLLQGVTIDRILDDVKDLRPSPNAINVTQIRFQSTKNKRPRQTGIAKPSAVAVANSYCKEKLSKVRTLYCVYCLLQRG